MHNDESTRPTPDSDEKIDKTAKQPEVLEDQQPVREDAKPKIPQVDVDTSHSADSALEGVQEIQETPSRIPEEQVEEPSEDLAPLSPEQVEEGQEIPPISEEPVAETPAEPRTESRFRKGLRKVIRWTTGVLIIFVVGLLAGIIMFYRPAIQGAETTKNQLNEALAAAEGNNLELQNQVESLQEEIASLQPLKNRNDELQADQNNLVLHIALLDSRLDVANAQLALVDEDYPKARVALNQTSETLDSISSLLEPDQQEVVSDLKQRLELVLTELDDDPFAAQSDLVVLEAKLLQLQDSLFGN
jgi:hypothetical protein